ncbi:MAG: site-specific integrase [Oleispira sp.]|nr:site-specific integrase [Oleispira sp.]
MNITVSALEAPTQDSLDAWLGTPRLAKCGEFFTPSEQMWWPDRSFHCAVNWQSAIACVPADWQRWLHAALSYRMAEVKQGTVAAIASILTRASKAELNPLNEDHLIDLRERFSSESFSSLCAFMAFWQGCESLEQRPLQILIDAYNKLPRKKTLKNDVILGLDPEKGPYTQAEQDALYLWAHDQFAQGNINPENYLYLRLIMIYGQRGTQLRMMVFGDFIKTEKSYQTRIFWAKQKDENSGWREKYETFNLDESLYNIIQAYQSIILSQLKHAYPSEANWDKAIKHVPLFRRKLGEDKSKSFSKAPVIIDLPNKKALELEPQARFHAATQIRRSWLLKMESMPSFPISPRTHQPLKISKGHRFRYTLGTDLSNAGLDEWSMASALMQLSTSSVRKYRAVSAELMNLVDEKMSDHLALVVGAFSGSIITDRASAKNGNRDDRQIEDIAVCGADTICHLDAPFSCYPCSKFQPLMDADHNAALERLERRRAQTIATDKTTAVVWDRAILACRKVIIDCNALRASSEAGKMTYE